MVTVTVTSGTTPYTWNNTNYNWDTVPVEATWDNCNITGHSIVAEYELAVIESYTKATTFDRRFTETFDLSDSYTKTLTKPFIETFNLKDYLVQTPPCVIYDVVLRSSANLDISKLRTIARQAQVAGYEEGVELLPGDYNYRDAIIGLVVTNNTGTKKIGFKNIDMYVDTPDIIDRGSINITNSGANYDPTTGYTTVYLNKPYHFVPNVLAAVVGGTQLGDYIFDPNGFTNVSFRVKIVLKSDHTTATTGTLLWEAVGY